MVTLVGQWTLIATGTYLFASWDVMEPIAYVMLLGNLILGYTFYTYSDRDFELGSMFTYLQERKQNQLYQRLDLDPDRLDILKQDIQTTKKELYSLP